MSSSGAESESLLSAGEPSSGLLFPDPWASEAEQAGQLASSGVVGAVLTLVNCATGPSLLLAPFAFAAAGALGGALLLLLALGLQMISVYMLAVSSHLSGRSSFGGLAAHFLSRSVLPRVADLATFLYALAVMVLHLIVVRDTLPVLVAQWTSASILTPRFLLPIFAALLLLPVSLLARRLSYLVIPSLMALLCTLFFVGMMIFAFATSSMVTAKGVPVSLEPLLLFRWDSRMLVSLAIFLFVLTPHLIFFPAARTLHKGPGVNRELSVKVTLVAGALSVLLYIFVGVFGYMAAHAVHSQTLSNILLQLDLSRPVFQAAAVAMLLNVVLNFGLFAFSAREALESLVFGRAAPRYSPSSRAASDVDANSGVGGVGGGVVGSSVNTSLEEPRSESLFPKRTWHPFVSFFGLFVVSVSILAIAVVMTLFIQQADLRSIAGVSGATLCMLVCFVLPSIFYVRAWAAPTCTFRHVVSVHLLSGFVLLCGVGIGVACTFAVIDGLFLY